MNDIIAVKLGKKVAGILNQTVTRYKIEEDVSLIRKEYVKEFGEFPPRVVFQEEETLSSTGYVFEIEGWGSLHYELDEWQLATEEKEKVYEKIIFYLTRFLRKYQVNCIDLAIEEKLKNQPLVLEYGENLVDIIESEEFYHLLEETKNKYSLGNVEWSFWESEYATSDEIVVYVYGRDYFSKQKFERLSEEEIKEIIISDILTPILEENKRSLQQ